MLSSLLTLGMLASGCGAEDRAKNSESQSQSENANSDAQGGKSDGSKGPEQAPKSKEKSTGDTTQDSSSGPKAIGDSCEADEECASTICRELSVVNPLDGDTIVMKTCATCRDDEACVESGAGIACVVNLKTGASAPVSASYQCSDGSQGSSCESGAQCQAKLKCSAIKVQGKAVDFKTCGDCDSDSDCPEATPICASEGATQLLPSNRCIPEGGKQDGETCSGEGDAGSRECANYCRTFGGLLSVCVPCIEDAHCAQGERCAPEELNPSDPAASKLPECVSR